MKWLLVLSSVLVALSSAEKDNACYSKTVNECKFQDNNENLNDCNALFSGFLKNVVELQKYANHQVEKSFEYLLLAANFGTYVKNRPGFEKQFRALSDKSWENGIKLIKHITKRGGVHDFAANSTYKTEKKPLLGFNEMQSLALALDYEKTLAKEAHHIHQKNAHAQHTDYDPEVAHFIEEEFLEYQAGTVRKLSGYTNDLKKLLKEYSSEYSKKETGDSTLALYLFDEYLAKQ
ncbi:Ferritin-1, chloroplastic [Pseudolycoriella hygida]|uniref:Ferritin n=1 Tax=Pseudolycoriella hygida TaxID=35572 RepID=A0A9Q0MXF2_9DIPT|nr:Ferritin-1, chloroplastic [Pseudolycoriella hygida]